MGRRGIFSPGNLDQEIQCGQIGWGHDQVLGRKIGAVSLALPDQISHLLLENKSTVAEGRSGGCPDRLPFFAVEFQEDDASGAKSLIP